jgi:hypothetical protein
MKTTTPSEYLKAPRSPSMSVAQALTHLKEIGFLFCRNAAMDAIQREYNLGPNDTIAPFCVLSTLGMPVSGRSICPDLLYLDTKCVGGPEAYPVFIKQMLGLTHARIALEIIESHLDYDDGEAWVVVRRADETTRWDLSILGGWLPRALYDRIQDLAEERSDTGDRFMNCAPGQDGVIAFGDVLRKKALSAFCHQPWCREWSFPQ